MGVSYRRSRQAKLRGWAKKARRHREERRAATAHLREARNVIMFAQGHPGWTRPEGQ